MWGAEDLTAALGGRSSRFPTAATVTSPATPARRCCWPPAAHGKPAIDSV